MKRVMKRRRNRIRHTTVYGLIPKKAGGRAGELLADPAKMPFPIATTTDMKKALTFKTRSGAYRLFRRAPQLRKLFKNRQIA